MLTVDRRQSIHRHFRATRDRQVYRARLVEMHDKTGRQRRPTRQLSATTGSRWSIETGWVVKKCSLTMIGKVSALASRIQVLEKDTEPVNLIQTNL